MSSSSSSAAASGSQKKHKVAIVGSGNWGSAIARIAGQNTQRHSDIFEHEVQMYVFEEDYKGKPLSQVINETHENPKYLPDANCQTTWWRIRRPWMRLRTPRCLCLCCRTSSSARCASS